VYVLIFIIEQNSAGIDEAVSADMLLLLVNIHVASRGPLCENIMLSTKLEVDNVWQSRQRKTRDHHKAEPQTNTSY